MNSEGTLIVDSTKKYHSLVEAVEDGCKIINFSLGIDFEKYKDANTKMADESKINSDWLKLAAIRYDADRAYICMNKLINENKNDFVVVQSAGNDSLNDTSLNGGFSGIESRSTLYLAKLAIDKKAAHKITSRIIVVGSTGNGIYTDNEISSFSNKGNVVDIYAPGYKVYSLGYERNTNEVHSYPLSGTSMAAPCVTAVCGMIWAANKNLNGEEVKNIITQNYNRIASGELTVGFKPIVNAKLSVEAALGITDSISLAGHITGNVIYDKTQTEIYAIDLKYQDGGTWLKSSNNIPSFSFKVMENVPYKVSVDYSRDNGETVETKEINDIIISRGENKNIVIKLDDIPDYIPLYSTISGTVSDSTTGKVLPNTTVEIYTDKKYSYEDDNNGNIVVMPTVTEDYNGTLVATATSDINGSYSAKFEYNSIEVDSIYVKANCDGYDDFSSEYIDIKSSIEYDILLKASNSSGGNTDTSTESKKIKQVALGYGHSAAITEDGSLYTWGWNAFGELGNGTNIDSKTPIKIMDNVVSFSMGNEYGAAITIDRSLYLWGINSNGQLGNGTETNSYVPIKIMDNVASVSLGDSHSAAITTDGGLYMWGDNYYGQLGNGTTSGYDANPNPIKIMDNVVSVILGDRHSAAITTDGSLYMWGDNTSGKLGNGTSDDSNVPIKIMDNVTSVSLGDSHSAAITTDGSLYMWGENFVYGQLGNNTSIYCSTIPVKIMDNVASVSLGGWHSAAITNDGSLYMWGSNIYGQLGNGTTTSSSVPIKIEIPSET